MKQYIPTRTLTKNMRYYIAKRDLLSVFIFFITFFMTNTHNIEAHVQKKVWIDWADYLSSYPDYRQHKEPEDIAKNGCSWGTWVTFPNKIAAIEAKVGSWSKPERLFESLDFVAMYKHPYYYYKHCLAYLADIKPTENQKKIAIYALELLSPNLYLNFANACYELYKEKLLSPSLFQLVLGFEVLYKHPLVDPPYAEGEVIKFLQQLQAELYHDTDTSKCIESILSGKLLKGWHKKSDRGSNNYLHYGEPLSIPEVIRQANKELDEYFQSWWEPKKLPSSSMNFLMLLEHANCYLQLGNPNNSNLLSILGDSNYSDEEKRLFIFAMQRLGCYQDNSDDPKHTLGTRKGIMYDNDYNYNNKNPKQAMGAYRDILWKAYYCYGIGKFSLPLLEYLLHYPISFGEYYIHYPFYVMHYKSILLQEILDDFIASPVIPCGWKDMAQKLKKGTLLSKEKMKYLEGYKDFLENHFTLYETIPPPQDID
jgi:hypothetical protein